MLIFYLMKNWSFRKSISKKEKNANKEAVQVINDASDEKYDWGGDKIETVKDVEELKYQFGSKKKQAQTPFEHLNINKIKSTPVQLSGQKKKQKKEVDELEQQLEDLF